MTTLSLNDEHLKAVMSTAILSAIGPEERDRLITGAIEQLISKKSKGQYEYGEPTTPLQDAFAFAVERYANEVVREMLSNDEAFKAKIRAVVADAAVLAFSNGTGDALAGRIANVIANELSGARH